jgi:hypothetical protein
MKRVIGIFLVVAVCASCQNQKKQWFDKSPEIDMVKKLDQAFAAGDWTTFRGSFADTAKIWVNTPWTEPAISADSVTRAYKSAREGMSEIKLGKFAIYDMAETDKGDRWIHRWGVWEATFANGKTSTWTSNANFKVVGGKIISASYFFNALPIYLANQPDPAPAPSK